MIVSFRIGRRMAAALLVLGWLACPAWGVEPAQAFLDALRNRRLYDVALDYLDAAAARPSVPVSFKSTIPYEKGVTLVEAARVQRDQVLRQKQLDESAVALSKFISDNPNSNLVISARRYLGTVVIERSRSLVEKAKKTPGDKAALHKEARDLYTQGLKVYTDLEEEVRTKLEEIPKALDAKRDAKLIERRDALRADFLQSQLLGTAVREEMAETHPLDSKERKDLLAQAAKEYGEIHEKYRTRLAGLYARLYQGRCEQKLARHKEALALFNELLSQPDTDPAFRALKVKTVTQGMDSWLALKLYPEAVSKGLEIVDNPRPNEDKDDEFMGLRLKVAQAIKAYTDELKQKDPKNAEIRRLLTEGRKLVQYVARFPGDYQNDARKLVPDFTGGDSETAATGRIVPKTFEEAKSAGRDAIQEMQSAQLLVTSVSQRMLTIKDAAEKADMQKQVAEAQKTAAEKKSDSQYYFKAAQQLADKETSIDDVNLVRYLLCYLAYTDQDYFEAATLGEFISRRYPASQGARKCAQIALASYLQIYQANKSDDKAFESERIIQIAEYIVKTWPNEQEAAEAINTLIPFMIRDKQLARAQEYLERIPADSPLRGGAELKLGQALWSSYLEGSRQMREWESGDVAPPEGTDIAKRKAELEEMKNRAKATLIAGVQRMQAGGEVSTITVTAVLSLAQIFVDTNESLKAVALLEEPKVGTLTLVNSNDANTQREGIADETYKTALRAYISSLSAGAESAGTIAKAKGVMDALKTRMGATSDGQRKLVAIYVSLARDLQQQMDLAPPDVKKSLGKGFEVFLDQVGKDATELNVLNWVAETYRGMGESFITSRQIVSVDGADYLKKAADTYRRILDLGAKNASFLQGDQATQLDLQLARTLRLQGNYVEAMNRFEAILKKSNQLLSVQLEAARTYQHWADLFAREKGKEANAIKYYESAMRGARIDNTTTDPRRKGKPVIWGWAEIARLVAGHPQFNDPKNTMFREAFHEGRYNLALCGYKIGLLQTDKAARDRSIQYARRDIALTKNLFPDLGGDKWRAQYDKLLRDIQKQLNERPIGLTALEIPGSGPPGAAKTAP